MDSAELPESSAVLSAVASQLGMEPPKRVVGLDSVRVRGMVEDRRVDLSYDYWRPDPTGAFSPSPFMTTEILMVGEDEALAEELGQVALEPFDYWSYRVKYQGSAKSLGFSRWKGPPGGFVFPDGTFIADVVNDKRTSLTIRMVEDIYQGQTDPLTMPSLANEGASVHFDRRDLEVSADEHIVKIRQLLDFSRHLEDIVRR